MPRSDGSRPARSDTTPATAFAESSCDPGRWAPLQRRLSLRAVARARQRQDHGRHHGAHRIQPENPRGGRPMPSRSVSRGSTSDWVTRRSQGRLDHAPCCGRGPAVTRGRDTPARVTDSDFWENVRDQRDGPTPASDPGEILQRLYQSEINLRIGWIWDGGVAWQLGDKHNGLEGEW